MSSNTENTEAKLAAYIDGQLDPAERAQIEQYLQANPDHRKLLADMIAQRDVLRSLPRDKAPADIYDAVQAQLERSVLLDDSAHAAAPAVRHARRSSLFAVAAILLLAVGLGVVLYFALPSSTRPTAIEVASSNQPATATAPANETVAEQAPPAGDTFARREAKPSLRQTKPSAPPALAEAPNPSVTTGAVSNFTPASPLQQALAGAATQSAPDAGQLVLLVSTDDPSKVNRQVETYLESNKIRWEAVDAPADQVLYSRAGGTAVGGAAAQKQVQQQAAPVTVDNKLGTLEPDATGAPAGPELAKKFEADKVPSGQVEAGEATTRGLADATASVVNQEQKDHLPAAAAQVQSLQVPQSQQQRQPTRQYFYSTAAGQKEAARQQYIIARGMTRQQAVQLTDTLSSDGPTQRARLIGQVPARARLDRQQDATLTLSQAQATTAEAAPATLPSEDLGAGVTQQQSQQPQQPVQQQLAQQQPQLQQQGAQAPEGQAAAVPQAATTSPVEPAQAATTEPTTVATTSPTTQPEPSLDVVILVEDESPAAPVPATAPTTTTAPSTAPATQSAPAY